MKKSKFLFKTALFLAVVFVGVVACNKDETFENEPETSSVEQNQEQGLIGRSVGATTHYTKRQVKTMYQGLSIKGSGGGGSYQDGLSLLNRISSAGLDVQNVSDVDNNKIYIVAGGIGSPASVAQNIDGVLSAIESSVGTLVNVHGGQLGGILSVESGSLNSVIAMLISQRLNVPLINADGAGRSVPELNNLSYAHEAYTIAPMVLTAPANPGSQISVSNPANAVQAETFIRNIISQPGYGNIGGLALWAQTGSQLRNSRIVQNTFSDALALGRATKRTISTGNTSYLDNYFRNRGSFISSYTGTLSNFTEQTVQGLDEVTIDIALSGGRALRIGALNENLLLKTSDGTIVTAPNLMSYMIKDNTGKFVAYNNGDPAKMRSLIGKQIHVVCSRPASRLYQIGNTFLDILSGPPFDYHGGVVPPQ
jgi:DUF917 family protein